MAPRGTTSWPAKYELASPIRWSGIAATMRAIAASSDADFDSVTRLVVGLTEPLRQLDRVAALTAQALTGDAHATSALKGVLVDHHRLIGSSLLEAAPHDKGCGCGCGHDEARALALSNHATVDAINQRDDESERAILDESGLISLALAVA